MLIGCRQRAHLVVIDPATDQPDLAAVNDLALAAAVPVTYHAPGLMGMQTLSGEVMAAACGLIILGSVASVNEPADWLDELKAWLMPQLCRGLPTLGICFGHQLLASLFGGAVGSLRDDGALIKGARAVTILGSVWHPEASGPLFVSHGEGVLTMPQSMRLFARSDGPMIEGLAHNSLPIWTLQAHPEANTDFIRGYFITGVRSWALAVVQLGCQKTQEYW